MQMNFRSVVLVIAISIVASPNVMAQDTGTPIRVAETRQCQITCTFGNAAGTPTVDVRFCQPIADQQKCTAAAKASATHALSCDGVVTTGCQPFNRPR